MSKRVPRIFIVDDDEKFNKSLARLVKSIGFDVETFICAKKFLERKIYKGTSCLLLDVRLPGLTGPDLQEELRARKINMPIVFLTAHGDVPTGVNAMKNGAVDFLPKPVEEKELFHAINTALEKNIQLRKKNKEIAAAKSLIAALTPREREVMSWLITGMLNKQVASYLGATERTIKAHRSQIMRKLGVVSVAELVRLALLTDISPAKNSPR